MWSILYYALTAVEFVVAILLLLVILVQRTKSQGMGMAFGSSVGESLFGTQMGNVLTRSTVVLAGVFLLNTVFLASVGTKIARPGSLADDIAVQPPPPIQSQGQFPAPAVPDGGMQPMDSGAGIPATETPVAPAPDAGSLTVDVSAPDAGNEAPPEAAPSGIEVSVPAPPAETPSAPVVPEGETTPAP